MSYLDPALPLLLAFGILGLIRAWRDSDRGKRPVLLTISIVGILALSMNVSAWLAALPLEIWYDQRDAFPNESAEAIVVLAGTAHSPTPDRPYTIAAQDSYARLEHAVWLFKHWKPLPILVCGGASDTAETMVRVLQTEGVPADRLWSEKRSTSTHENALYGSQILHEHGISRIALVVEANSMPRAAASFRKMGMVVVPAPIRFTKLNRELSDLFPSWNSLALNGETLHEFVGLIWYRFRGWI